MSSDGGATSPLPRRAAIEAAAWENEGGPALPAEQATERLDWTGFLARFHPHARRHDYESLAGYIEYQKRLDRA